MSIADEKPKLGLGCKALIVAMLVATVLLVLTIPVLYRQHRLKERDRRFLEHSSATIEKFFRATTTGDIAAAKSELSMRWWGPSAKELADIIREEPESFSVARIADFETCELIREGNLFTMVVGAKLELTNGKVKYCRVRCYLTDGGWAVDAFNIEDAPPATPHVTGD